MLNLYSMQHYVRNVRIPRYIHYVGYVNRLAARAPLTAVSSANTFPTVK